MVDFKGLGGKKLSISKTEHRKPNTNENHPYKDNTSEEDKKCIVDVTSPWWTLVLYFINVDDHIH